MYQEVHRSRIPDRAQAPEIATILSRFEQLAAGPAGAPYEALCEALLPVHGDEMMILAPTADEDYVYVHFGRAIVETVGGDRTGELISRMSPHVARFTGECYDRALADGRPAYTVHRSLKTVRVAMWERLIMPATAADGRRFLVVFSRPLQFRDELLTTVLDTSPSGIVALRALRDEDGDIASTMIITANRRAGLLCGLGEHDLLDRHAREALPFLADDATWRRCLYAIELRRADQFEVCFTALDKEIWLQIAVAPLGDGLVMTLTDISSLMIANLTLQSRAATLALEIGVERATRRALSEEIGQREERERALRRLAETDPLTALLNRRSFIDKAQQAIAACETASLMIIDLDHFKRVNDTYGHAAGDAVIRAFADLLLCEARSDRDLVGRFGGEEFVVLLPGAGAASAASVASRIRTALSRRELPVSETLALRVTASIGVATSEPGESFASWLDRADQALYRAKGEGRDCIRAAAAPVQVAA